MKNKVVLVTGGSKGLGREIVRLFAKQGADVAFTYSKDVPQANELVKEIKKMGKRSLSIQADASDFKKAQKVVDEVHQKLGGMQILVCNAGIAVDAPLWEMTEAQWDRSIHVSLKGVFNYIRAAAPIFMEKNYGKIVCIGSINGLRGRVGSASYNVAKAGLIGLVKTAAAELGRFNINVNLVAPGFIESSSQSETSELIRDLVLKECAIKRLGTPKEIAPLVLFLSSDDARHITGQTIKVDAGQYL